MSREKRDRRQPRALSRRRSPPGAPRVLLECRATYRACSSLRQRRDGKGSRPQTASHRHRPRRRVATLAGLDAAVGWCSAAFLAGPPLTRCPPGGGCTGSRRSSRTPHRVDGSPCCLTRIVGQSDRPVPGRRPRLPRQTGEPAMVRGREPTHQRASREDGGNSLVVDQGWRDFVDGPTSLGRSRRRRRWCIFIAFASLPARSRICEIRSLRAGIRCRSCGSLSALAGRLVEGLLAGFLPCDGRRRQLRARSRRLRRHVGGRRPTADAAAELAAAGAVPAEIRQHFGRQRDLGIPHLSRVLDRGKCSGVKRWCWSYRGLRVY